MLPGRQSGDDVVLVSPSNLERSGSRNKRSKQELQHDVEPNVETQIGMQEPSSTGSTYQFHPHAGSTTAWNWAGGSAKSVQFPGFSLSHSRLSCNAGLFTVHCGHAFGPAVSEASNFMTNRHGRTRPFETVAPGPRLRLSFPAGRCMPSPKLRGTLAKITLSFVCPVCCVASQRALEIELFR